MYLYPLPKGIRIHLPKGKMTKTNTLPLVGKYRNNEEEANRFLRCVVMLFPKLGSGYTVTLYSQSC